MFIMNESIKFDDKDRNLLLKDFFKDKCEILKEIANFKSVFFYTFNQKDELFLLTDLYGFSKNINAAASFKKEELGIDQSSDVKICKISAVFKKRELKKFKELAEKNDDVIVFIPLANENIFLGLIIFAFNADAAINEGILVFFAEAIMNFLENTRLKRELKKSFTQFTTLTQISKMIVSGSYLKEILKLIVTMTAEVLNSKILSIMLLDEAKQELFIEATQSLSEEYINKPALKVGESISGRAVKEKKPITVLNVIEEPQYRYKELAKKEGIVSMLAVPMMIKDKVIGVINCYTSTLHNFTEDEIGMLQSVANQAAVAIENTKLMEEIIATREMLETRKIIDRAKAILMKDLKLDEDRAHKLINRKSMNSGKPMKEIAEAIILSDEIRKMSLANS